VAFMVSVISLVGFAFLERARRRQGRVVLVDLGLFGIRSFAAGNVAVAVVALGEFGLLFVLPLFLQGVLGYSALDTGLLFLALALGTFFVGGVTPQLARRITARGVARLGLALEAVGIVGLGLSLSPTVSAWEMVPWLFLYGTGVGMATAQLTGVILTDVPVEDSGQAAGIQSTARQVGSALGIAILGTILLTSLASHIRDALNHVSSLPTPTADRVVHIVRSSGGAAIGSLHDLPNGPQLVHLASAAAIDATRTVAFTAAAFILVGLVATLALPPTARKVDAPASPGQETETQSG
jgi:hypothetical protein